MAKSLDKKNNSKPNTPKRSSGKKGKKINKFGLQIVISSIVIGTLILLSIKPDFNNKSSNKPTTRNEPQFKNEGELVFFKQNS